MTGVGVLFEVVPDPRAGNARHPLPEILVIAFAATLCGAESCVEIAAFGRSKQEVLGRFLALEHGIPSHDTFSRVLRLLDPQAFEAAFRRFMAEMAAHLAREQGGGERIVAIDGKSLRGAVDAASRSTPLHLVTAWAAEQRLVLGLRRAPDRSEATAAREIIALLDLKGCTVTADALHGNRQTAADIRARGGDYALTIKGNRGPLHRAAQDLFADPDPARSAANSQTAHGRYEERRAFVAAVPADWSERYRFQDLAAMARIDSLRRTNGTEERQTRYIALSRRFEPDEALRIVRAHWSIENNQHWMLDVAFREDTIHTRNDNTAENLAILRRLALNLLRTDTRKASTRVKIKQAAWDNDYLGSLIAQMR